MIAEIGIETARRLIDFSGGQKDNQLSAEMQLQGAVALHNILVEQGVAYLADEVGMGKTYVALGVVALFRHFHPEWRVLYIAPSENIQSKWKKELLNFTRNNWSIIDNRVRSFQSTPAYGIAICHSLIEFAREAIANPNRDFLVRMSSFSFGLSDDPEVWKRKRKDLLREIPWLSQDLFHLKDKDEFKDCYAHAINLVLPHFDLVVIDEGHNLKAGLKSHTSRNRLIAAVLGHPECNRKDFPGCSKRFSRALLLSATPLESDFAQLWNQLDLFTYGSKWPDLKDHDKEDSVKEKASADFLVRRLTELNIAGTRRTKNQYRREWREGGVVSHDDPLTMADERQRLTVALVQKKVAELLNTERFNHSFQMGMLASFESFFETARPKRRLNLEKSESDGTFDNPGQADTRAEKEGIDTGSINEIAKSYRKEFGEALPHPKMDAVANSLRDSFNSGEKALVFVRRVRSVDELTDKLNAHYDEWIEQYLNQRIPTLSGDLQSVFERYREERKNSRFSLRASTVSTEGIAVPGEELEETFEPDEGGIENFFAWFFRGKGPASIFSGAAFKRNQLTSEGAVYSTFFEENYLNYLFDGSTGLISRIASELKMTDDHFKSELRQIAAGLYARRSRQKGFPRKRVYDAYQEAALKMLGKRAEDLRIREQAEIMLVLRYGMQHPKSESASEKFPAPDEYLSTETFFTKLRKRQDLERLLMPDGNQPDFRDRFLRHERMRELLVRVAILGHAFIDLWILAVRGLESLRIRAQKHAEVQAQELIEEFLDLLEEQSRAPRKHFTAFRELNETAENFDLIVAVNFPQISEKTLDELATYFGTELARQTPVGGMSGGVNRTLVSQFRMPGYPLALVTTDVLQEGEDLHTFCSRVLHYGISWTPSSMEQRTGRIDRFRCKTHRRLLNAASSNDEDLLQVYYPHLRETVERLQVHRVYERMNRFIRTMHRSITGDKLKHGIVDTKEGILMQSDIEPIREELKTAFPVREELLHRDWPLIETGAAVQADSALKHFKELVQTFRTEFETEEEPVHEIARFFGTLYIKSPRVLGAGESRNGARRQPFTLFLKSAGGEGHIFLRCLSPVGEVPQSDWESIEKIGEAHRLIGFGKVCAVRNFKNETYNLTVEADLLFHPETTQRQELFDLVAKTTICADRLEQMLLNKDEPIQTFILDLKEEPKRV